MNQLNDLFEGLTQGAAGLAQGFLQKDLQKSALSIMQKGMSRLEQLMNPEPTYQDNAGNPLSRGQVNLDNSQQVSEPDYKAGLQQLYQLQTELAPFGDLGKQYGSQLESFWNNSLDLNRPPKKDIREVNGQLVDITNGTPQVLFGEPKKEKPPKKTIDDYGKMSYEDLTKLTPDEIMDAYYFTSKENQDKLYGQYQFIKDAVDQNFKQGDYAPSLRTGRRLGGLGKINLPSGLSKDENKFQALDEFNERIRGGEQLTEKEQENYNTLRLRLGEKYNMDDTQLASFIDRINQTTNAKERAQLMKSLESGNYYEDKGTNQEQIDYDRNRILEWQSVLNDAFNANDGSYDGYKQSFLKELKDFYSRGSLTKKEYDDLIKSYY